MDLPQRPSHSPGSFERTLAHDLANSLCNDDHPSARRRHRIPHDPAASSTVPVRRAAIRAPRAVRTTQRHSVRGLPLARRLENRARRAEWKNKSDLDRKIRGSLPLGKRNRLRGHNLPRRRQPSRNQLRPRRSGNRHYPEAANPNLARPPHANQRRPQLLLQIHPPTIQRRPTCETKNLGRNHRQGSPVKDRDKLPSHLTVGFARNTAWLLWLLSRNSEFRVI